MDQRGRAGYEEGYPIAYANETLAGTGFALHISREGCLVESDIGPKEGTYLEVTVDLCGEQLTVELAAVRWVNGRLFALEFLYMRESDHERLDKFIARLHTE